MNNDERSQSEKFAETAKKLECDPDEKHFASKLGKVVRGGAKQIPVREESDKI